MIYHEEFPDDLDKAVLEPRPANHAWIVTFSDIMSLMLASTVAGGALAQQAMTADTS